MYEAHVIVFDRVYSLTNNTMTRDRFEDIMFEAKAGGFRG